MAPESPAKLWVQELVSCLSKDLQRAVKHNHSIFKVEFRNQTLLVIVKLGFIGEGSPGISLKNVLV